MKQQQLSGIGKFERIAEHYVIGEPIAFETPNTLKIKVDEFREIFTNPSIFYKFNIELLEKKGKTRFLAIDSVKNVKRYVVAHEVGHKVFLESKLTNKEQRLKDLYKKTLEDKSIYSISDYAKMSAEKGDLDEFFAEIYAMWSRKDVNLNGYLSDFVEDVLE